MDRKKWLYVAAALIMALVVAGIYMNGHAVAQGTSGPEHSVFTQLAGPFETPQDVTAACLGCHQDAAKQVMGTIHWTWQTTDAVSGEMVGKKNVINNSTIALASNEPFCTTCHAGYGYADNTFDFSAETSVDCLVCHADPTVYKKLSGGAGMPEISQAEDLATAAKTVGKTRNTNCGTCHFFDSNEPLKHGGISSTLANPTKEQDVHMGSDALNLTCSSCHARENHVIAGSIYNGSEEVACLYCHTGDKAPHVNSIRRAALDEHAKTLACQTCHIPTYARGEDTVLSWDWSTAGQLDSNGMPVITKDDAGHIIYDGRAGSFTYGSDIIPTFRWWNGETTYITVKDKIDSSQVVKLADYKGSREDGKIYPFKLLTGKTPYDSGNNTMVVPNLYSNDSGDTDAFWSSYNWGRAITSGMAYAGADYSGKYDFANTEFMIVQNHQVAPKEEAARCADCHTTTNSRIDFASLGYTPEQVIALSQFPPQSLSAPTATPQPTATAHLTPTPFPSSEPKAEPASTLDIFARFTAIITILAAGILLVVGIALFTTRKS